MKRLILLAGAAFCLFAQSSFACGIGFPRDGNTAGGRRALKIFKQKMFRSFELFDAGDKSGGCMMHQQADDITTKYWWDIVAVYKDTGRSPKEWVETHRKLMRDQEIACSDTGHWRYDC